MTLTYGKRETTWLKGVAIMMMVFHHLFGFPRWIGRVYHFLPAEYLANPTLEAVPPLVNVATFCKLCVGLFAFSTGYAMYLQRERYRSLPFRLKRAFQFLRQYWFILFLFYVVGLFWQLPMPDAITLRFQLIGLYTATGAGPGHTHTIHSVFAWYVFFYLLYLLLAPRLTWLLCRFNFWVDNVLCFALLNITITLIYVNTTLLVNPDALAAARGFVVWGNVGMTGYIFAKYDTFSKLDHFLTRRMPLWTVNLLCAAGIAVMYYLRTVYGRYIDIPSVPNAMCWDVVYSPLLLFCILRLLTSLNSARLSSLLGLLAHHSTNIWFIHGIFFTVGRTFQWLAYWPRLPLFIYLWTMLLCIGASMLVDYFRTGFAEMFTGRSE